MDLQLIDTADALKHFLGSLGDCHGQPPRFYVDLEGNSLSRHGTPSLMTIMLKPEDEVYLVDITTLRQAAFTTASADGRTLQSLLESKQIIKVFFSIRNDSDALFALYGIQVAGIEDLQLMELACRSTLRKTYVSGLAKCIERDTTLTYAEKSRWQAVKDLGVRTFDPAREGSYAVFDQRPLSKEIQDYCVQDVLFMSQLRDIYRRKLCDAWWLKIEAETTARIQLSQSASYNPKGQHKALGPSQWQYWEPGPEQRRLRTLFAQG